MNNVPPPPPSSLGLEIVSFDNIVNINKLMTNRIALVDADFIKYMTCNIRKKQLEEQINSTEIFLKELPIITITKNYLQSTFFNKIEDPIIFCFSGKSYNTFRSVLCFEQEYKSKRKLTEETYPGQFNDSMEVLKYIKETYATLLFDDLEADDIVAVLQDPQYTYILSKDKDLKQVPGFHYDFENNTIYEIDNNNAAYNLAHQLLAGDSVDEIPGIPMVGDKKAKDFLQKLITEGVPPSQFFNKVLRLYQEKFGVIIGTDMFAETWQLVKMRMDRGKFFKSKYKSMYDTKEFFVNRIKINLK